MIILKNI